MLEAGKSDEWIMQKFVIEVALMSKLSSHPSFVPLVGCSYEPAAGYLALLTDYMPGGSLHDRIHSGRGGRIGLGSFTVAVLFFCCWFNLWCFVIFADRQAYPRSQRWPSRWPTEWPTCMP